MTAGEAFFFSILSFLFWSVVVTVVLGGWK
jgi:hypothetical protein